MRGTIHLIAPRGYAIKQLTRYKSADFKNGVIVKDDATEMRKTDIEEKMGMVEATDNTLR